jgi:hypothetical protein
MRNVRHFLVPVAVVALLGGCSFAVGGNRRPTSDRPPVELDDTTEETTAPAVAPRTLAVGKSVWYAGLKITVDEVTHAPQADEQLTAKVLVDNLSAADWRPSLPILFSVDQQQFRGTFVENTLIGGKQKGRLVLQFHLGDWAGDVTTGEFIIGSGSEVQSKLPLGSATLVANEPRPVLPATKVQHRDLTLSFKTCELRSDFVPRHDQAQSGKAVLACWLDVQLNSEKGHVIGDDEWRLKLPDGTVVGPTAAPSPYLYDRKGAADTYLAFQITWPAAGTYAVQFVDLHDNEKETPERVKEVPVTL